MDRAWGERVDTGAISEWLVTTQAGRIEKLAAGNPASELLSKEVRALKRFMRQHNNMTPYTGRSPITSQNFPTIRHLL
jgi:hypothetical protein